MYRPIRHTTRGQVHGRPEGAWETFAPHDFGDILTKFSDHLSFDNE